MHLAEGIGTLFNGETGRTSNLLTVASFGDVQAHIEFVVPRGSNSGIYFQGRYELQILDSWGVSAAGSGDCGGIYERWDDKRDPPGYEGHAPRLNASPPPGAWQSFDVTFRAPRFDGDGKKTANACFERVLHNGVLVHENVELSGPTRASAYQDEQSAGPLMLQGDHGPVAFRNVWLAPLEPLRGAGAGCSFFAMDTGTKDKQRRTIGEQLAMIDELGYDGLAWSGKSAELPALLSELDRRGLGAFPVYVGVAAEATEIPTAISATIRSLEGRGTALWLYVTSQSAPSSPDVDEQALPILRKIADLANASGVKVALYPHTGFWIERLEDAMRVAQKVDRANLGVSFNLCHWLRVEGQRDPLPVLMKAMPRLMAVSLNGADAGKAGELGWGRLIQTLDRGSYDLLPLLEALVEMGYSGPIGLQGYGIGGDAYDNLQRSMKAWRGLNARLRRGSGAIPARKSARRP